MAPGKNLSKEKDASIENDVHEELPKTEEELLKEAEKPSSKKISKKAYLDQLEDAEYTYKQLNRVLYALDAFKRGDISVRLQKENDDIFADIAEAYNSMV